MGFILDYFSLGGALKLIGFGVAIAAFVVGPLRNFRTKSKGGAPVVPTQEPQSFLGKVGAFLAMHSLVGVVLGFLTLPVVSTIICAFCAFVIWLLGGSGQSPWSWLKSELKDVAQAARPVVDDKKEAAAKAYEEARKAAADSARRIEEARRQAAEALAEKQREAARAAERIREMERSAAEKVREAKEAADARVKEAKDLADKAAMVAKTAGAITSPLGALKSAFGGGVSIPVISDPIKEDWEQYVQMHQEHPIPWERYRAFVKESRKFDPNDPKADHSMTPAEWLEHLLSQDRFKYWEAESRRQQQLHHRRWVELYSFDGR